METFLISFLLIILLSIGFIILAIGISYYVFKSTNDDISSYFDNDKDL